MIGRIPSSRTLVAYVLAGGLVALAGAAQAAPPEADGKRTSPEAAAEASSATKTYRYTATTRATATRQGKVTAGRLAWSCRKNQCTISGPWPVPGVSACNALARQVGEIVVYGHPASQLGSSQLRQCNQGIPTGIARPGAAEIGSERTVSRWKGVPTEPDRDDPAARVTALRALAKKNPVPQMEGSRRPSEAAPSGASPSDSSAWEAMRRAAPAEERAGSPPEERTRAQVQREQRQKYVATNQLRNPELDRVAESLARRGAQQYAFASSEGGSAGAATTGLDFGSATTRRGLLLMRDRSHLQTLGEGVYTDDAGTVFEFGKLPRSDGKSSSYSISRFGPGNALWSVDVDDDGVVDLAASLREDDGVVDLGASLREDDRLARFGVLANELGRAFWGCLGENLSGNEEAASSAQAVGGGLGEQTDPCAAFRGSGGGGGFGSGALPGGGEFSDFLVGDPDCRSEWDLVSDRIGQDPELPSSDPNVWDDIADIYDGLSGEASDDADRLLRSPEWKRTPEQMTKYRSLISEADRLGELSDACRAMANSLDAHGGALRESPSRPGRVMNSRIRVWDNYQLYQSRVRTHHSLGGRFESRRSPGGATRTPGIGPDGMPAVAVEDPRCAGRRTAASQGRSFMDKDFCKGLDMVTCLVKQQDATFTATGRRCRKGIGPDDQERLECERQQRESREESVLGPGGPDSGPTDGPRNPLSSRGSAPFGYVETTPLGAVMAGFCAQGGCPEDF